MEQWKEKWKKAKDAGVRIDEGQVIVIYIDSFPSTIEWTPCTTRLLNASKLNAAAAKLLQEHYHLLNKGLAPHKTLSSSSTVSSTTFHSNTIATMNA
ncbi:hypothetical protein VKT23_012787 [Stygiomarasmius scandens]|uniref:Uncharacterized protein n=1 Tax=Marasmiellus scandens TaxID=2682957 RepID=A0ABR1J5X0_9AGAR